MMSIQTLYDTDFGEWIQGHIVLLKESRLNEIDTKHLIEELEDMGKRDKRELKNRLEVLIMHLLKWQYQAEQRSNSWKSTIKEQRRKLNRLLKDAPSLKNNIDETVLDVYADAAAWASEETGLSQDIFAAQCSYTQDQLLDESFYPND
jgi:hypothetical protein